MKSEWVISLRRFRCGVVHIKEVYKEKIDCIKNATLRH